MSRSFSLRQHFQYGFDNFMSKGSFSLIAWLGLFTLILVFCFALVVWFLGIAPQSHMEYSLVESFWINLMHLIDPGNIGQTMGSWIYLVFMLTVTIIGVIILSTLIGLVSNGILDKIEELRKGRSFVVEKDHVLILGWSSKIFTIISELVIANENQKHPKMVVLADMDKVKMEDEIRDKVGDTKNTRVVCRSGNPIDLHDLQISNPENSKAIIILDTEDENSDSQIIKTILAIVSNRRGRDEPYHITAEISDKHNYEVAKMVGKDEVELILSDDFISKIMVQTSRQSGLSVVYIELMDFGGDEIYFTEETKAVGLTFLEVVFSYEDTAVIGIQYADGTVELNPKMSQRISRGDKIIGITEDDDTMVFSGKHSVADFDIRKELIVNETNVSSKSAENILLIGWNDRASTIIKELDQYLLPNSRLKILSKFTDAETAMYAIQDELENLSVSFEEANTTDIAILEELNCDQYNYIILLCYQNHYPIQEADAQTLITLLHLRNISEASGKRMKMVSEMLDMRNRQLADVTRADDFIVSDKLLSLLMTQVAENKYLMRVFEDLFDAEGSEIYIKPVHKFVLIEKPVNFYTVLESAARKGEVAIGYRIMKHAKDGAHGYGVVVNPKKSTKIQFAEEDMIIVLAED